MLVDAHLRVEASFLGHVADTSLGGCVHRRPAPSNLSGVGPLQPEDDAHRSRLAGAVRADEAEHLTRSYVE